MQIDSYGWVDDVRALPGECGSEISRRIYLHSLMKQGTNLQQLKQMGFSKEMVTDMNKQLVREEYGPKVGDLVKYIHSEDPAKFDSEWNDWHGIITRSKEVQMPGQHGLQTMCNVVWTNGVTGRTVTDYIPEQNLKVLSKCK